MDIRELLTHIRNEINRMSIHLLSPFDSPLADPRSYPTASDAKRSALMVLASLAGRLRLGACATRLTTSVCAADVHRRAA